MIRCGSQVMLRGWRETLLLFFVSANICFAKNNVEGGGDVLDILSSVKGSFTQTLDDDLSLTVSYDLADDSRVPISFVTGIGVTKGHDFFRKKDPTEAIARLTLSGSMMTKERIPSGGFVLEANDRSLGVNANHAIRRVQFRFGRTLLNGRVKIGLSPLVTYGALRRSSVDFGQWVPSYRPLLSEAGVPRMSLQQRDVEWDWSQGMPSRSPFHGLGVSLRLHAGRRGWLNATLFNGRERSRLWSFRAEAPLVKPSNVSFNIERVWQVRTTAN